MLSRDEQDPLSKSSTMTGEPALTAVRLLGNLGERAALLLYASGGSAPTTEVIGGALRALGGVDPEVLAPLLLDLARREDDGLLMAVCDVLVEMPESGATGQLVDVLLTAPTRGEVYEFLVASIVASRRTELIERVVETLPREMSRKRLTAALEALRLAPQTPAVIQAVSDLEIRVTRG
jgi:hypothetical protein